MCLLEAANYPGTEQALLDDAGGLDSRAAAKITAYRNGPDGVSPSSDDVDFTDIGELDAIPYVGNTAFEKLGAYAAAHPAPAAETVEGVYFRGWQAQTVVWAVNHLDFNALDAVLDSRAANGVVAGRPYASVTAMGPVSYVGPSALGSLRDAATDGWPLIRAGETQSLGGTFDGVDFDEPTAKSALAIANDASVDELTAHGMTAPTADSVLALVGAPSGSTAELRSVDGFNAPFSNSRAARPIPAPRRRSSRSSRTSSAT